MTLESLDIIRIWKMKYFYADLIIFKSFFSQFYMYFLVISIQSNKYFFCHNSKTGGGSDLSPHRGGARRNYWGGKGLKKFAYIRVNRQLIVVWILLFIVTAPKVPFLEKYKEK